ncbi:MAG: DEAD/DEAH box helicase [Bacteroidetes bacterium]|nr:DEAD/DEAH box helicase [Bacteroidota bacterium]
MPFSNLSIIEPILKALKTEGYTKPTPIQEQSIPVVLQGKDLLGCAQTGTGKTAAFAIPILQILHSAGTYDQQRRPVKSLILTPTRELAVQIGESFAAYGRHTSLRTAVVFGGVSQYHQEKAMRNGADILIATPGRLLDLMNQRIVSLNHVQLFVLDEADRMLDMGFIHDVKKIVSKLPAKRQTLLFSATMPSEIRNLAHTVLNHPVQVAVTPVSSTVDAVSQSVFFVERGDKKNLLIHLLKEPEVVSALVFSRTKHGAEKIARDLHRAGIKVDALHGNKTQGARQRALNNFKTGRTRVLVATDIAARGIDVDSLSHVINYDMPDVAETYVHRIGRTARAGLTGNAWSFCDADEMTLLKDVQKLTGKPITVVNDHPFVSKLAVAIELQRKELAQRKMKPGSLRRGGFRRRR